MAVKTVFSKLPRAGLGNKLFVWAHGVILAHTLRVPHRTTGWLQLMLGPWLRMEKHKRWYAGYFKQSGWWHEFTGRCKEKLLRPQPLAPLQCTAAANELPVAAAYLFHQIPHWDNYFGGIREHHQLVKEVFFQSLRPDLQQRLKNKKTPVIGVHIRMGDFRALKDQEDFAKVGAVRTPLQYFIETIEGIRQCSGAILPVTIFSDGKPEELQPVLDLPGVQMAEDDSDMMQLLHLGKSGVIVLSAGSTFGQWAGFLSEAVILHHPQHYHSFIRGKAANEQHYEGVLDDQNQLLISRLQALAATIKA
jgi:hypothetical protein